MRSTEDSTAGVPGQGHRGGRGGLRGSDRLPPSAEETGRGGEVATAAGCEHEACGQPQVGAGHPRRGWVMVKAAGEDAKVWCCSWYCLGRYAVRRELGVVA